MARYKSTGRYVPGALITMMGEKVNRSIHNLKKAVDEYKIFDTDVPRGDAPKRLEKAAGNEYQGMEEYVRLLG